MKLTQTPGALKKFKRTPWRFQQTVKTPLKDLERFVSNICASNPPDSATVTIDEFIDARNLAPLLGANGDLQLARDASIEADADEAAKLLGAALADWLDFLYVPTPKSFAIYADHDEYATFYANSKSALNKVILPLKEAGFTMVEDWERTF